MKFSFAFSLLVAPAVALAIDPTVGVHDDSPGHRLDRRLDDASIADGTAELASEPTLLPSSGKGGKRGGSKGRSRSGSAPSTSPAPSGGKASASRSSKGSGSADTEVSFPLLGRRRRRLGSKALKKSKGSSESTKSPKSSPAPTTLATIDNTEIAP